ncbi:MAG: hypothetical protein N838_18550 [Thiohalocapsa sp. PB-PSB1]|nr:MAG: hypothetical protein N838_18550 [Thiohalocapsa sp. PB-PSB1]
MALVIRSWAGYYETGLFGRSRGPAASISNLDVEGEQAVGEAIDALKMRGAP